MEWERAARMAKTGLLVEDQARKVVAAIMERAGTGDTLRNPNVADYLREWMNGKELNQRPRTAARYKPVIEGFITSLGVRATRPLVAITPADLQRYVDARRRIGSAPGTVQVDGKILRTAFNRARRMGLIASNPVEAVDLPARNSVERGTFTGPQVRMLVDAAQGEWKTLILLGYYTGQRLMDCARLEWAAVDFTAGKLAFTQEKTTTTLVMPMHEELHEHLEALASTDKPEQFVMPGMAQQPGSGRNGLSSAFKRIAGNAGVDIQTVQGGGTRMISKRTFHALRHSFTSALANAGVAPELRMKLTGHKSEAVHAGYTNHELETLRAAIAKLPGLNLGNHV